MILAFGTVTHDSARGTADATLLAGREGENQIVVRIGQVDDASVSLTDAIGRATDTTVRTNGTSGLRACMRGVCFDMDGVLVDSEDYWPDYEREILADAVPDATVGPYELTGLNYREIHDRLDRAYGVEGSTALRTVLLDRCES